MFTPSLPASFSDGEQTQIYRYIDIALIEYRVRFSCLRARLSSLQCTHYTINVSTCIYYKQTDVRRAQIKRSIQSSSRATEHCNETQCYVEFTNKLNPKSICKIVMYETNHIMIDIMTGGWNFGLA